ncbi:hypothetical protein ASPWEDRAFT_166355 [Aspergillus wentii DTO 134E9]|uniref:Zn(2)-C6 fungal-type domain-containing protein n=1 Tax=Aspergillus wentii DTO 134E9 TaxID=1073089 RepID=A0A1L9RZE3_ASPWE|nr:uncharacterized protein ASPWEDRAFT_166355 [Aspergillus wentii DTO 134E9]KAI9932701.1 hypothetical protein MW887_008950 [Aspergillus wentii]OJJ40273.1 hypothetical protein ASPWEDRAFT_166355 [Aspergillus wentii DTO 134E9]
MTSSPLLDQVNSTTPASDSQIATSATPKRPFTAVSSSAEAENRRKDPKVTRACDNCKTKKIRCNGTLPCSNCTKRRIACTYDAKYGRGRHPPTPPPSDRRIIREPSVAVQNQHSRVLNEANIDGHHSVEIPSRASPDVELEGQYVDPTSGVNFLHRAWEKIFTKKGGIASYGSNEIYRNQLLTSAGDRPFYFDNNALLSDFIPDATVARSLLAFYFDTCVVTYRMFHRQTTEKWMEVFLKDREQQHPIAHSLGHAKCAILLTILAVATLRSEKTSGVTSAENEDIALRRSDQLFCTAMNLTDTEMGFPRLESAQARLIQLLYLLQTSRMNKGWYTSGITFHIALSLGMHRRRDNTLNVPFRGRRPDYITSECCKRTFWVAYTIDKYLSVVFGRPRFYQDEDIDQDFPDSVNDEYMTPQGPSVSEDPGDCLVDSLIFHAKIARIIGKTSRDVYSVSNMSNHDRAMATQQFTRELHTWRVSLPPHLGTVKPSTLMPCFRRQAIALQLAYSHAIIHANRPSLLGDENADSVAECIAAAKASLELVDKMASDSTLFYSFWWTPYVTFCALVVVYVWQIQQSRRHARGNEVDDSSSVKLFDLAERCQSHLMRVTTGPSPSRRYNIILEELRLEAQNRQVVGENPIDPCQWAVRPIENSTDPDVRCFNNLDMAGSLGQEYSLSQDENLMPNMLDTWQITDWLTLDSSAFFLLPDTNSVSPPWLPTMM